MDDRTLRGIWSTREYLSPAQLTAALPILGELGRPLQQLAQDGTVLVIELRVLVHGKEWRLAPVTVVDPEDPEHATEPTDENAAGGRRRHRAGADRRAGRS